MQFSGPVTMQTLPPHIRPEMVHPFPFYDGRITKENPFTTVIPELHRGPEVFYTLDGYHGLGPIWVFRRFKDMETIYGDTEHFSNKDFSPFAELNGGNWNLVPAESDLPEHRFHRGLMNPLFTPKRMAALEEHVRGIARESIARFRDRGECEYMSDMAFEFPIAVFLELVGWPKSEMKQYLTWERQLIHPTSIEDMRQGTNEVIEFLREMIAERRKNLGDDLISYGITTEMDGRRYTEDELLGFCFNLFIGGLESVSTNVGWEAYHLATHPDHQAYLRANLDRVPEAVEELLRAYSAVTTTRRCIKPVVVNGVQLMPGDQVALITPLGSNDPERFPDPATIKLDRNPRHVTFGSGIHRCVGAPLARRELIIAIQELLKALPEFRIKPGAEIQSTISGVFQIQSLPLVWQT